MLCPIHLWMGSYLISPPSGPPMKLLEYQNPPATHSRYIGIGNTNERSMLCVSSSAPKFASRLGNYAPPSPSVAASRESLQSRIAVRKSISSDVYHRDLRSSLHPSFPSHLTSTPRRLSSGHRNYQHALTCSPSTHVHVSHQSTNFAHVPASINGGQDVRVVTSFQGSRERAVPNRQADRRPNPCNSAPHRDRRCHLERGAMLPCRERYQRYFEQGTA